MFQALKLLSDKRHPRRGAGLFFGGIIVMAGTFWFNPAGVIAASGNEQDPPAKRACAGEEEAGLLYGQLRERYIDLRKDTLAMERERKTLDESRKDLQERLERMKTLHETLDTQLEAWEEKRSAERAVRLDRLVGIVAKMGAPKAAELVAGTEPELAVDLLVRLDQKHAAAILEIVPAARAATFANAISLRSGSPVAP